MSRGPRSRRKSGVLCVRHVSGLHEALSPQAHHRALREHTASRVGASARTRARSPCGTEARSLPRHATALQGRMLGPAARLPALRTPATLPVSHRYHLVYLSSQVACQSDTAEASGRRRQCVRVARRRAPQEKNEWLCARPHRPTPFISAPVVPSDTHHDTHLACLHLGRACPPRSGPLPRRDRRLVAAAPAARPAAALTGAGRRRGRPSRGASRAEEPGRQAGEEACPPPCRPPRRHAVRQGSRAAGSQETLEQGSGESARTRGSSPPCAAGAPTPLCGGPQPQGVAPSSPPSSCVRVRHLLRRVHGLQGCV